MRAESVETFVECTACGAENEPGSRFCNECGESISPHGAEVEPPHERASAPGMGTRIAGIVGAIALIALGIVKLTNRPTVQLEVIEAPDVGYGLGATRTETPRDTPPE